MTKIAPLSDVANLQSETTAVQTINENSDKIEAAFANTLSRDGSTPNAMGASLDMNNNKIINAAYPELGGDVVNKDYVDDLLGGLDPDLIVDLGNIDELVQTAVDAAAAAEASAEEAASYVGAAVSAPKWTTARTITTTGDATGTSPAWDGSTNLSFSLTIPAGSITAGKLAAGVAVSNLGYTPLNTAGGTLTGQVINSHVPTSSLDVNAIGFRGVPVVLKNTDWAFVLDDCGKLLRHDSGTGHVWGISNTSTTPYPAGFAVLLRNVGAGSIVVYRAPGVSLYKDGSAANADVVLSQWGKALLIHEGSNIWNIGGSGIS